MLLLTAYLHLPFIVMAGLALCPRTADEGLAVGCVLLVLFGGAIAVLDGVVRIHPHVGMISSTVPHGGEVLGIVWLLFLMTAAAVNAGMSPPPFPGAFPEHAARAPPTRLFARPFW